MSWAMWAIGRGGWAASRPTRTSLPAGVSRALAWAMRPPVSAVPPDTPHLTPRPHLTSTTSIGRTPRPKGGWPAIDIVAQNTYRTRLALAEPVCGELRQPAPGRTAGRGGLQHAPGGPGAGRGLADRVQHRPAGPQRLGLADP